MLRPVKTLDAPSSLIRPDGVISESDAQNKTCFHNLKIENFLLNLKFEVKTRHQKLIGRISKICIYQYQCADKQ